MMYYNQFWMRIVMYIKSFLKDKSKIDSFNKYAKSKLYNILLKLTTKEQLDIENTRQYIIDSYKSVLPHYLEENPFENTQIN